VWARAFTNECDDRVFDELRAGVTDSWDKWELISSTNSIKNKNKKYK
jgi:hypothetical protein